MFVLGIVGSPAGGKSTVATRLEELGATWINADLIARSVLEQDEVQQQLIARFGALITDERGRIDRSKLAAEVFGDDAAKRLALDYLEGLIHPRTRAIITSKLQAATQQRQAVAVLDVPLLFESGWDRSCDQIWCIDSPAEQRLQRVAQRGWTADELRRREANQLELTEKRRRSDVVIENDGTLQQLHQQVDQRWQQLQQRLAGCPADSQNDRHCAGDV